MGFKNYANRPKFLVIGLDQPHRTWQNTTFQSKLTVIYMNDCSSRCYVKALISHGRA